MAGAGCRVVELRTGGRREYFRSSLLRCPTIEEYEARVSFEFQLGLKVVSYVLVMGSVTSLLAAPILFLMKRERSWRERDWARERAWRERAWREREWRERHSREGYYAPRYYYAPRSYWR